LRQPLLALPDPGCAPGCSGLTLRYDDRAAGVGIFAVPDPQPFLWFPGRVVRGEGVPTHPLETASTSIPDVTAAALSSSPLGGSRGRSSSSTARIVGSSGGARLVVTVHADRRRLLVVREASFPGWRATIDGRPVSEVMVDGVFQGVVVPSGTSRVVLTFRPDGLSESEAVSLAAVAWAVLSSAAVGFRRRHGRLGRRPGLHSRERLAR